VPVRTRPDVLPAATKERGFYRLEGRGSTSATYGIPLYFNSLQISIAAELASSGSPILSISGIIGNVMQPAKKAPQSLAINEVKELAAADMQAVDLLIRESLQSDVALVSQVSEYIVASGGKRLRPLIVLLAARALGYTGNHHVHSAAIIEFIHTATLLHDDVVDSSARRRGRDTANTVFGNQASVLVGDFLYSRAFQMMVDIGSMRIMRILADATNTIAAGEVLQLMNVHDADVTEDAYLQVIYRKTACLFEAGAQIAAVLAERDPADEAAMITFGKNLGTAYQLIDDVLDYDASPLELGKNLGDDLAEGKTTLPLIYAMKKGSETERNLIRSAIESDGIGQLDEVHAIIESTGALDYTISCAQSAADQAIDAISAVPDSEYRHALTALAEFSVRRRS
jgi:octaprenyl-diphosphate synthase